MQQCDEGSRTGFKGSQPAVPLVNGVQILRWEPAQTYLGKLNHASHVCMQPCVNS